MEETAAKRLASLLRTTRASRPVATGKASRAEGVGRLLRRRESRAKGVEWHRSPASTRRSTERPLHDRQPRLAHHDRPRGSGLPPRRPARAQQAGARNGVPARRRRASGTVPGQGHPPHGLGEPAVQLGPCLPVPLGGLRDQPQEPDGFPGQAGPRHVDRVLRRRAAGRRPVPCVLGQPFRTHRHGHRADHHGARDAHAYPEGARAHGDAGGRIHPGVRHLGRTLPCPRHGASALVARRVEDRARFCSRSSRCACWWPSCPPGRARPATACSSSSPTTPTLPRRP